jgi:hypothetical protein
METQHMNNTIEQNEIHTYSCENYRNVKANNMREAALIFALRAARREYGSKAIVVTCNQQAMAMDGSFAEYQAFVGVPHGSRSICGKNIRFSVYLES